MIEYERITGKNISALKPFFETYACGICDNTIGAVYQWRDIYESYYAIVEGMLCIRAGYGAYVRGWMLTGIRKDISYPNGYKSGISRTNHTRYGIKSKIIVDYIPDKV